MTPPPVRAGAPWSVARAEAHLRSLELFGMRFGLDRMRRMMTALGSPERSYESIHVIGTNGKSSTTRMIAAILARYGLRTGSYTSPHLVSYRERLQVGERDLEAREFAGAIAGSAHAAERVNRTLGEDDHVTQFELLTAAAFAEMARQEVQVAVVEAGLGGRYDATSVIDSRLTVLTTIGLEHTRWLGPTLRDIAEEKLAVVGPNTTLVLGARLAAPALDVATRVARHRGARIVHAPAEPPAEPGLAPGSFQRRNFALACAASEELLRDGRGRRGPGWGEPFEAERLRRAVREAALSVAVPGRLQLLPGNPPTVLDAAHNPDAVAALLDALPAVISPRPLALVLGVLEDKDAAGMLGPLLSACERAWFTAPPSGRALPPAALQSLARQRGFERVACTPRPAQALAGAQRWAREHGGAVLATGSVYLVGDLLAGMHAGMHADMHTGASTDRPDARASAPWRGAGR
jgi:dihydrofolate synthase / folylpolyglutamate synthase